MDKITKDSHVKVEGWTEQEVQQAAEKFSDVLCVPIGDTDESIDFCYLVCDEEDVWVGSDISASGRTSSAF